MKTLKSTLIKIGASMVLLSLTSCTRLTPDALPVEREHWRQERPAELNSQRKLTDLNPL